MLCTVRCRYLLVLAAALALISPGRELSAYTPESPEVVALVQKGLKILETEEHHEPGGKALIALALFKGGADPSHPKIQEAVNASVSYARTVPTKGLGNHCYNAAVCVLLLTELNHEKYRTEIQNLLDGLAARQRPNGAWSYEPPTYDDTSQTQYGVLALWAGHVHGFEIEASRIVNAMNWFISTQKPGGGWAYDPRDTAGWQPTQSMSAAGAGSLYICAYLLGFGGRNKAEKQTSGLPAALRPVDKAKGRGEFLSASGADYEAFKNAANRGNSWMATRMTYTRDQWTHYFMYGLERYKAFQALVEGRTETEPKWYNDGVEFLLKSEEPTGGWKSMHYEAPRSVSTAFAVLFLTRSTAKAIQKLEGMLRGGQGLPADLSQVAVDASGKLIDTKEIPPLDVLLGQLEKEGVDELDLSVPSRLQLSDDPGQRAAQLARLRRMATRGPFEVRLMAVNTLGRDRNLDNVPVLIYALSDPDPRVMRAARDGLRFISRKIGGVNLSDNPTKSETEAAQRQWREWFLTLRPDATFIE